MDSAGAPHPTADAAAVGPTGGDTTASGAGGPGRKIQSLEVAVFLFLIVPSMALSFLGGSQINLRFTPVAISSILNDLALLSLVLYFLWRNHEPVLRIGWNFRNARQDAALGLVLFIPIFFGANMLAALLHRAGASAPANQPSFLAANGPAQVGLALLIVVVVAIVEETVFRGYLMLRLSATTGSVGLAVVLSSVIFALGHGYEGVAGTVSVFVLGVIFALLYIWRKSVVAPVVIHFLTDFTSIVLPALLGAAQSWH